jgi:hypothetical protein
MNVSCGFGEGGMLRGGIGGAVHMKGTGSAVVLLEHGNDLIDGN